VPADRPPIPAALTRAIRVEAGHRCAIPTCRATSGLQIHHIADWAKVREHTFANLVHRQSRPPSEGPSIDTLAVVSSRLASYGSQVL
jgi:hypothetical protein